MNNHYISSDVNGTGRHYAPSKELMMMMIAPNVLARQKEGAQGVTGKFAQGQFARGQFIQKFDFFFKY